MFQKVGSTLSCILQFTPVSLILGQKRSIYLLFKTPSNMVQQEIDWFSTFSEVKIISPVSPSCESTYSSQPPARLYPSSEPLHALAGLGDTAHFFPAWLSSLLRYPNREIGRRVCKAAPADR